MPLIYNGQEAGFNRRLQFFEKDSIDWNDQGAFTAFYRSLNALRKSNSALLSPEKGGAFEEIPNDRSGSVWSFRRVKDDQEVVCIFNFSANPVRVAFDEDVPGAAFRAYPDSSAVSSFQNIDLKPWEYRVFYK
ncbi:MAG TPA: hypothetical protein DDZ78_11645 [Porphyromonadaceae bacterium]|nr:hypothetical protein [Porphyromonadaceae bacterium]